MPSVPLTSVKSLKLFAGEGLDCRPESGLHDAAGRAEDDARAGALAERIIEFLVGQEVEVEACGLDHPCKLSGGESVIDVGVAACGLIVSAALKLLGSAGHDADDHDILRVEVHLLGVPGLGDRAEHLLRGFAARKMIYLLGEVMLAILDPAG